MPRYRLVTRMDEEPEAAGRALGHMFEHCQGWGITVTDLEHTSGVVFVSTDSAIPSDQVEHLSLEVA